MLELAAASRSGITWKEARLAAGNAAPATITKILRVLTESGYLVHEGGRYRSGATVRQLVPARNAVEDLLARAGAWADEIRDDLDRSTVIALLKPDHFEFIGVSNLEEGLGYAGVGTRIFFDRVHALSLIRYSQMDLSEVRKLFENRDAESPKGGRLPSWDELVSSMKAGVEGGLFCEHGWNRSICFRAAAPLLSEEGRVIGAVFSGNTTTRALKRDLPGISKWAETLNQRLSGEG
ncbi:MAG: IclR family transcriptional regulator [Planctomycetota bacterium]